MNSIYIVQDDSGYAVAATFDEGKARELCKGDFKAYSYRSVPIVNPQGMEVIVKAPPIPMEYLPKAQSK